MWPIGWALMSLLGFGFLSMYSITTNLKSFLAPASGHRYFSAAEVGTMLTVYTGLGVVHSLVIPLVIGQKHDRERIGQPSAWAAGP